MSGRAPGFRLVGTVVTGTGTTPPGHSDHFYGAPGTGYLITIKPGADLSSLAAVASAPGSGPSRPAGELIAVDHGSLTNDGTLEVYPATVDQAGPRGCTGCLTPGVIDVTGTSGEPTSILNAGVIGDRVPGSLLGGSTAEHGNGQVDAVGIAMAGGTIDNAASGTITGYNAVVTTGPSRGDVLNNAGVIDATHDGVISRFLIVNHPGGRISTGLAGFASVRAGGDVVNYGYLLGQDFGVLMQGNGTYLADYGGPPVPGVVNYDGSRVHDGEISAVFRSTHRINTMGPYLSGDAVLMDSEHASLALHSTASGGTVWLPVINGPMVGGFNGDSDSPSAHQTNTLAFDFHGIPPEQLAALRSAVAHSAKRDEFGTYYTGQFTLRQHVYHWVDWAAVTVDGRPVTSATSHPARPRASESPGVGRSSAASSAQPPADVAGLPWVDVTAVVLLFAVLATIVVRGARRRPRPAGSRARSHAARARSRD
jgi:hypothetical protein